MAGERTIHMGSGDYRETNVSDHATYVEGNYYNNPEQKQNLTEIAQEISELLTYFENNPPTNEAIAKVNAMKKRQPEIIEAEIIEAAIKTTPTLQRRIEATGKAVSIETVKTLFPPFGIAIEGIKAWNNPE